MWRQWLGNRAAIAISPACSWRRSFDYLRGLDAAIAGGPACYLSSSASLLPNNSPLQWQVHQEATIQLPRLGQTLRPDDVMLVGWGSGIYSQLPHHSSSSAPGRGGRNQDYTQVGGPIDKSVCDLSESEIRNLLSTRSVFLPQNLANIVGAFAKAGVSHPLLFEKVAEHIAALDNLEEFKPQELANIVWAIAKVEVSHPGFFDKIAHHIVSLDNLEDFNQQDISNLIWGFGKADVKNIELFDKLAEAALDKEDEFTARDIANLLILVDVAENDPHPQDLPLKVTDISTSDPPQHGTCELVDPNDGFNGTDVCLYTVCDENNQCDEGAIVIAVEPVNDVAIDDFRTAFYETPINIYVKDNDIDPNDDLLTVDSIVSDPSNGTVTKFLFRSL